MLSSFLQTASSYASDIDNLTLVIAVFTGFWLLAAEGVLFWFLWKYRKSASPKAQYITGEKKEETKWIHWPHNAVLVLDVIIIVLAVRVWYHIKQDLPQPDETVKIVAQQWGWHFIHPGPDKKLDTEDDVELMDQLHVKVDTTYHFKLSSMDVNHSFSVPAFRLKQDAIPGREITGWFRPTKTGEYDIQCTEICGIGHALMPARIHVETEQDHNQWLANQQSSKS